MLETSAFRISVRWPIYIINSVDKTKIFVVLLPHRRSTTVSLETTPIIHLLCFKGYLISSSCAMLSPNEAWNILLSVLFPFPKSSHFDKEITSGKPLETIA